MHIAEPIRRIPWPIVDPNDPEALVTREWLVTNGLGGYASGTVGRRDHAPLSRPADRGAAGAARPHGHAQPPRRTGPSARRSPASRSAGANGRRRADAHGTGYLTEFRLEGGPAGLALRRRRPGHREARVPAAHAEHRARASTSCVTGADAVGARAAPVGELPRAGSAGQRAARLAVRVPRRRRPVRNRAAGQRAAAAAAEAVRRRRHASR